MNPEFVYTDSCCEKSRLMIKESLGMELATRLDTNDWTISDAMSVICLPSLKLAVINVIDEISVMEMALLHFMCKPILVTANTITGYPIIKSKVIDYVDFDSDLRKEDNNFISWYKGKWEGR